MNPMILTFVSMASSIGMVMQNAASNQRSGQTVATASATMCCRLILTKGSKS